MDQPALPTSTYEYAAWWKLPAPDKGKLIIIMIAVFQMGWRFEYPAIMLVFLPIVLRVVETLQVKMSSTC